MATTNIGKAVLIISTETGEFTRGIDGVTKKVQELVGGSGSLNSVIGTIGPNIAAAFSIGAISAFAKQVIDMGGHLVDMRDKTGISVEGLQVLGRAAELAGGTLDQVTNAVSQMQRRIAAGDDSALGALRQMGITLDELNRMSPDQQFVRLARGIREVEDPAQRVRLAVELFGRSGADLLPVLVSDIDSVARSTNAMATNSAEWLDWLGDQWTNFAGETKAATGNVMGELLESFSSLDKTAETLQIFQGNIFAMMRRDLRENTEDVKRYTDAFKGLAPAIGEAFKAGTINNAGAVDAALAKFKEMEEAQKKASAEAKKHADEQKRVSDQLFRSIQAAEQAKTTVWDPGPPRTLEEAMKGFNGRWDEFAELLIRTEIGLRANDDLIRQLGDTSMPALAEEMRYVGLSAENYFDFGPTLEQAGRGVNGLGRSFGEFFTNIPASMGVLQEKVKGSLLSMFGASQNSMLGSIMNGGLSMVFGPLTGLMSQWAMKGLEALSGLVLKGLKKIGGYFKDLFGGPDKKELAGREVAAEFETTIAGMLNEQQKIEAGGERWKQTVIGVRDAYIANGLSAREAEIDVKRLWDAEKIGPEAARAVIAEIEAKMRAVGQAAADAGAQVSGSLGDAFSQSEEDAQRFADRQKQALKDMAESGKFSAEELELAQIRAAESIRLVFDDLADRGFDIPVRFDVGDLTMPDGLPIVPMADGGIGRVTGPTLFMAGENGAEDFAFSGGGRRFGAPAGGGGTAVLMLNDRVLAEAVVPQMPGVVRRYGLK